MSDENVKDVQTLLINMKAVDTNIAEIAQTAVDRIRELEERVAELEDENESLWFMLDEIKESQTWTKEQSNEMQKSINEQLVTIKMMQQNKGEA
jgi:hypothetical protein